MGILPIPRCHKAFKSKRVKSRRYGHLARTTTLTICLIRNLWENMHCLLGWCSRDAAPPYLRTGK